MSNILNVPNNWGSTVIVSSNFLTAVANTATGVRNAQSLRKVPEMGIRATISAYDAHKFALVKDRITRNTEDTILIPLYSDQVYPVTGAAGARNIYGTDLKYVRIWVGSKIILLNVTTYNYQVLSVATKGDTQLTTTEDIAFPIDHNIVMYPLLECDISEGNTIQFDTDMVSNMTLDHVQAPSKVFSNLSFAAPPIGLFDLPLFDDPIQWSDNAVHIEMATDLNTDVVGRSATRNPEQPAYHEIQMTYLALSRKEAFSIIDFFYSRKGSALPFWLPIPITMFKEAVFNEEGSELRISDQLIDLETFERSVKYLAVEYMSGDYFITTITSVVRDSGDILMNVTNSVPDIDQVRQIFPAMIVNFATDELVENWETNTICQFALTFKESINEESALPVNDHLFFPARVTKMGVQVLSHTLETTKVTRMGVQVLTRTIIDTPVRISKMGVQVLSKRV